MTDTDLDERPPAAPAQRSRPRRPRLLTIVLGVLALALAVACVVLLLQLRDDRAEDEQREAALAAARQTAVNFTTVNHETVDRDLERVLTGATGEFREDFEAGAEDLKKIITDNEVESTGSVLATALVSSDPDSAVVLIVVDSTVSNSASPEGQIRRFRIQMDLAREDGRWRTSTLEFVG